MRAMSEKKAILRPQSSNVWQMSQEEAAKRMQLPSCSFDQVSTSLFDKHSHRSSDKQQSRGHEGTTKQLEHSTIAI